MCLGASLQILGHILGVLEMVTVELLNVEGLQSTAIERPELVVVVDVKAMDGGEGGVV